MTGWGGQKKKDFEKRVLYEFDLIKKDISWLKDSMVELRRFKWWALSMLAGGLGIALTALLHKGG